jgi:hypothetical protein
MLFSDHDLELHVIIKYCFKFARNFSKSKERRAKSEELRERKTDLVP